MASTNPARCNDLDSPVVVIKCHRDINGNYFCNIEELIQPSPGHHNYSSYSTDTWTKVTEALEAALGKVQDSLDRG